MPKDQDKTPDEEQNPDKSTQASAKTKIRFKTNVPRHTRELSAADFKRLGVEHGKLTAGPGEVVEVPEEVAQVLVESLGEFERVDDATESTELKQATNAEEANAAGGGSSTGANTRDGAGARSASIAR